MESLQEVTQEAHEEDHRPRLLEAFKGKRVAVLTGAGTSTSAGLPDFQDLSASWPFPEPREVMLSLYYWQEEPKKFWQAFRYAFPPTKVLSPTPFHRSLARLESVAQEVRVFTQNVDGLHQKAGSTRVTELHGNLKEAWDLEVFKASRGREGRFPLEASVQDAPQGEALEEDLKLLQEEAARDARKFKEYFSVPFVDFVRVKETAKGRGLGKALYVLGARLLAKDLEVPLRGSSVQSKDALLAWKHLAATKGLPLKVGHGPGLKSSTPSSPYFYIDFR